MTLTFPTLALTGLAFAAAPLVLHLLSRRRRRRVPWAAMEFLLDSDRRNRNRVRLDEWLLLASRVALALVAGLLAAGPRMTDALAGWWGDAGAWTVVLLDDSASMRRVDAGVSAWSRAIQSIDRLRERSRERGGRVTVVRYADAATGREPVELALDGSPTSPDGSPDAWSPTWLGPPAEGAIDRLRVLLADAPEGGSAARVCWLSDFAAAGLGDAGLLSEDGPLADLAAGADHVVLGACVETAAEEGTSNLALSALSVVPGPLAAGVPTRVAVELFNAGDEPVGSTTIALERNGRPIGSVTAPVAPPRGRVTIQAPLWLPTAGTHALQATLPPDRFDADNNRWLAIEAVEQRPVLIVDDARPASLGRVVSAAVAPLRTRTGWAARVVDRPPADALAAAPVVVLADTQRLSRGEAAEIADRVTAGAGVLMLLGPRTDATRFNELWPSLADADSSLGRLRLGVPSPAPSVDAGRPTLRVAEHPAMQALTGDRSAFLPLLRVRMRHRLQQGSEPRRDQTGSAPVVSLVSDDLSVEGPAADGSDPLTVLATLTDGEPLLVAGRHGEGRFAALLTSLVPGADDQPAWSNLASLPVTPVLLSELIAWLAADAVRPAEEWVGATPPATEPAATRLTRYTGDAGFADADGLSRGAQLATSEPGVYRRVGPSSQMNAPFAAVVAPTESDLRVASLAEAGAIDGVTVASADDLFLDEPPAASRAPAEAAALLLLLLLAIERVLALRSSYVPSLGVDTRGGAS